MVTTKAFTARQVVTVAPGMILVAPVARQARVLMLLGAIEGRRITPAGKLGAGWRDMATQWLFYRAAHGDAQATRILKQLGTSLSSSMTVSVARPGTSSHGDSTRIDVLFNGRDARGDDVAFMRRHDWDQEFGSRDINHFRWTGTMSGAIADSDKNRIVAHRLNEHRLGRSTHADQDGVWPAHSNFSWLLQTKGNEDGLYPTNRYRIDGVRGDRTLWLRNHYFEELMR